jgi:hypothetical protein
VERDDLFDCQLDINQMSGYRLDMRQKVSTVLDSALYRRVKLAAVQQGRQVSEVIAEALTAYVESPQAGGAGVVASTWGSVPLDRELVARVLEEEDGLLEA